jgi:hypothetical protein
LEIDKNTLHLPCNGVSHTRFSRVFEEVQRQLKRERHTKVAPVLAPVQARRKAEGRDLSRPS